MIENTKIIAEKNKEPFTEGKVKFATTVGDWDVYKILLSETDIGFPMIAVNKKTGKIQKGNDTLDYRIMEQEGLIEQHLASIQSVI